MHVMPRVDAHLLYKKDFAKPHEIAQLIDYAKRKAKARFYERQQQCEET
jgi:hypothetical protein